MLSLDSPEWSNLTHAYGSATDIPDLLRQLEGLPSSDRDAEPWFSIWSSLAHQGDVYSASFAAVPHVVSYLAVAPHKADFSFFQFPAWVEICRVKEKITLPEPLANSYVTALASLPEIVASATKAEWDDTLASCALAAIAAAKGRISMAEAILEMNSEIARDFLKWHLNL